MHDLSHIERIRHALHELIKTNEIDFNKELTELAVYFHGIIYSHEALIRSYLSEINLTPKEIELVVKIAWESQKESKPSTNEGLLLHDAHMLEGGCSFEIIKSLITGSIRGQSLEETLVYIENNLLDKGQCYTKAGIKQYKKMKKRTREIFQEINTGTGRI